jgi:hypothetical protein
MIKSDQELPAGWWVWLRLAAILVAVWMGVGFAGVEHTFGHMDRMAIARAEQAAQLAGVDVSAQERTDLGSGWSVPAPGEGNRADQIVALGSLAALESDRASDAVTGMVATATAGVGSLVVFFAGLRDWLRSRKSRKRTEAQSVRRPVPPL